ncbi:peptidyl-tRNA hydrolase [Aliiroseovarius halocynthiae]|uniref:Peptidyl-tRNA hydrolase n=1 Tax=Aliiroseovarius halocynthiae TaxID=985055 RepID=A0A545SYH7_9RHOB|nr:aminoacyl-tRNA hydrolase [Aliiroseovarius halocynthiae]TQV70011.1 aminoacyl-tRNA hydrolase [Aliiroseovarius halocynthiae]SMR70679.1 peptidyl-tRNA hydrolase [Aliiroseovarius halocynthiae]
MKLFVGLGNPGAKYAGNRHNIGFMAVERIADDHGFSPWRGKFQGSVSEGKLGSQKVILLRPETFMNLSGQSVGEAMRFYKLTPDDVVVFHDELDLAPGKCRVKTGGGHAGHNGLRSIHAHIGADYQRVRMGIGHPGNKAAVASFVLRDFAKADQDWLDDVLRGCSDGAADLAAGDSGKFMNAIGRRVNPPRSSGGNAPDAAPKSKKKEPPQPRPQPAAAKPEDTRSPLQKLMDKFS